MTKTCKIETFAGEIFSLFHLLFLKGQKLGGKMTHSVGLLILKCLELLWVRPGCGTPGDSQSFITPFHVILQFSNPWKKYSSRTGGRESFAFWPASFLVKIFASLTNKHKFCHCSFQGYFCILWFVWKTREFNIFLLTMQKDILPSPLCLCFTVVS